MTTVRHVVRFTTFAVLFLLAAPLLADEPTPDSNRRPNPNGEQVAFEKAAMSVTWAEALADPCDRDWRKHWFLDGKVGTVTNRPNGMTLTAGPKFKNDAHHMVLWTQDNFVGDLKIEYEYTRLDKAPNCVTILYIQATGSDAGPYAKDITKWSELRQVPAMKMYYNHMNTYHISYAANPETEDAYLRGRRYMPEKQGLKGTGLKPDYSAAGLFATGVKHHITVIKKERDLYLKIKNPDTVRYFHLANQDLPVIIEGRIGLRHMFTRSARYSNFRVSRATAAPQAAQDGNLAEPLSELRCDLQTFASESAPLPATAELDTAEFDTVKTDTVKTHFGVSDSEFQRLQPNAVKRCLNPNPANRPLQGRFKKDWTRGVATIAFGEKKRALDFNENKKQ